MNSSKLYEWLLENDCPWEFEPVTTGDLNSTTIEFTEKQGDREEETEVRPLTDKEYWEHPEIKQLLKD